MWGVGEFEFHPPRNMRTGSAAKERAGGTAFRGIAKTVRGNRYETPARSEPQHADAGRRHYEEVLLLNRSQDRPFSQ
jgi:hypothetical protein